jgi:enediyne biosynthesis protein E4
LKNTGPRQNAIAITLTGTRSNRSAIGARCTIEAGGRRQMAEVVSGGSYFSQNALTLYFGLGKSDNVDRVQVRWPSGETQSWLNVGANRTIGLSEGSDVVKSQAWKR